MESIQLTRAQIVSLIGKVYEQTQPAHDTIIGVLTAIQLAASEYELAPITLPYYEFMGWGLVNDNCSLNASTICDGSNLDSAGRVIRLSYANAHYDTSSIHTFMEVTNGRTLVEYMGSPLLDYCVDRFCGTIRDALFRSANSATYVSFDLILTVNWFDYNLGHFEVNKATGSVRYTPSEDIATGGCDSAIASALASAISGAAVCTGMSQLCRNLTSGEKSFSDIRLSVNKFLNAQNNNVSGFFSDIFDSSYGTVAGVCGKIITLPASWKRSSESQSAPFWKSDGHSINTSIGVGLMSSLTNIATVVGTVLLYSGTVLVKVAGGALLLGGMIGGAALSAFGQLSGTVPSFNPEAMDQVYCDPLFQGNSVALPDGILQDSDLVQDLRSGSFVRLVLPFGVLYLYNYSVSANTVDYKYFINMNQSCDDSWYNGITQYNNDHYFTFMKNYFGKIVSPAHDAIQENDEIRITLSSSEIGSGGIHLPASNYLYEFRVFARPYTVSDYNVRGVSGEQYTTLWRVLATNVISSLFFIETKYTSMFPSLDNSGTRIIYENDFSFAMYEIMQLSSPASQYTKLVNGIGQHKTRWDKDMQHIPSPRLVLAALLYNMGYIDNIESLSSFKTDYYGQNLRNTGYDRGWATWQDKEMAYSTFSVPDSVAFITPPSHDARTILYEAIAGAAIVGLVVGTFFIVRTLIKRGVSSFMQRKGQQLLQDGQTFRVGWTEDEWKQLSKEDQATYKKALRKYNFRVNLYNGLAGMLGMSGLDWINNWWNAPASVIPSVNPSDDSFDMSEMISQTDEAEQAFDLHPSLTPESILSGEVTVSSADLYQLISGKLSST